jgi:transposase
MIHFIGLDVHRSLVRACIVDARGNILSEHRLEATRPSLEAFAKKHLRPQDALVLEATFNTWAIARVLEPFVGRVVVSNPVLTKAIAQAKIKTDKVDARTLAQLLRCDYLPEVWVPDEETQSRRTLAARRAGLVSERTRIKNRIHSVLAGSLIQLPVSDLFSDKGLAWLGGLPLDTAQRALIDSDRALLAAVEAQLACLDEQFATSAWEDPRAKLLMTLPGVDFVVAQTVLAALGDISRFKDADSLASYFGLVPLTHQSADHCYHGPITKRGNRRARWVLIQAAQHVAAHPGPLGVFMRRLLKKKNRNVAVVACARKLVVIAWHMLTTNQPYRYAQPRPTQDKLARLRVRATGKKRATGPAKGQPQSANYGTGQRTRRVPALPTVYEQEGLPPVARLKPAEVRALREQQVEEFVASLQQPALVPRRAGSRSDCGRPGSAGDHPGCAGQPKGAAAAEPTALTTRRQDPVAVT